MTDKWSSPATEHSRLVESLRAGSKIDSGNARPSRIAMKEAADLIERVLSPAQGRVPPGFVLIPQSALDWLDGSAPAPDGKWFGQDAPDPDEKPYRAYWWRSRFRELCSVPSTVQREGGK